MRHIIMTVGYIHSGKTTFGRQLAAALPHAVCLERDPIAAMLNDNFAPILRHDKANWQHLCGEKLKDKIYHLLLREALNDDELDIILTGCHTTAGHRQTVIKQFKEDIPGVSVIMVYFDIDMAILEPRVRYSEKPTNVLTVSKSFLENLERQVKTFEVPAPDEADHFFIVKDNANSEEVIRQIKDLVSS